MKVVSIRLVFSALALLNKFSVGSSEIRADFYIYTVILKIFQTKIINHQRSKNYYQKLTFRIIIY